MSDLGDGTALVCLPVTVDTRGFSLIELMITIAIVGILVAMAVPAYQDYQRKARMTELVSAAAPYKIAVAQCLMLNGGAATSCNGGREGIPENLGPIGNVEALTVSAGVIQVTPKAVHGLLASETYQLTPYWHDVGGVTWGVSGGALIAGIVGS